MNNATRMETVAALRIRDCAASLVETYSLEADRPAARIALLLEALEAETIEQGKNLPHSVAVGRVLFQRDDGENNDSYSDFEAWWYNNKLPAGTDRDKQNQWIGWQARGKV